MAIKMLALDLDGTLLTSQRVIDPETAKYLAQVGKTGVKIVLTSGRPLSGVMPFEDELELAGRGNYAIVFNGAVIQALDGHVMMSQNLDYHDFQAMKRLARLADVNTTFETTQGFYTYDRHLGVQQMLDAVFTHNTLDVLEKEAFPQDFTFNKVAFTCPHESEEIAKMWQALPEWVFDRYNVVRSFHHVIEIGPQGTSKGLAVSILAANLGLSENEVAVFGDQGNDLSMFENPNFYKVAMGNAIEAIKAQADYVTTDHDDHGVLKAVRKLVK